MISGRPISSSVTGRQRMEEVAPLRCAIIPLKGELLQAELVFDEKSVPAESIEPPGARIFVRSDFSGTH
jgi:hypothetical protein